MSQEIIKRLSQAGELIPAIVQDCVSKEVLMLAWVNLQAYEATISTSKATFWSRSRNQLWVKGESSGNYQDIVEIKYDCDADSLLFLVHSHGPACHTGQTSCFYRSVERI
jgi:phosphoribosyl-ATP pyrophosphohydrolase/phosphoribosyl-AMP cyclohydrolase